MSKEPPGGPRGGPEAQTPERDAPDEPSGDAAASAPADGRYARGRAELREAEEGERTDAGRPARRRRVPTWGPPAGGARPGEETVSPAAPETPRPPRRPGSSGGPEAAGEGAGAAEYPKMKEEYDRALRAGDYSRAKRVIAEIEKQHGTGRPSLKSELPKIESKEITARAERLARSGSKASLQSSVRLLQDALAKDPNNAEAKRLLALVQQGQRALSAAPPKPRPRDRRGDWRTDLAVDEVWVIERSDPKFAEATRGAGDPTQGELRAVLRDKEIPLPLKHTDVKAEVSAFVATVNVTQQYANPYAEKIEAVYVFPLPQDAAVTDFVMTIGDRKIRGIIREREEAKRIYQEAKRQGYRAALLTQERPNIFTQRVANIEPGKKIGITITYFNTLKYSRGEYEFVFPMVVGPRFNPAGWKDGVGAVARGARGTSRQPVEVSYMKPGERSGHDIAVTLDIDAGVEVERVASPTHAVEVRKRGGTRARVTLSRLDTIPNRDLVIRYKVAGKRMKTAFLMNRGEKGNHFALVLQPPEDLADLPRMPREMVFVLDCSGSMRGKPLDKVKEAIRRCLVKLGPDDTFQIIRFSNRASALGAAPLAATAENVRKGIAYLDGLRGTGGTQMIEGTRAALDFPHDPKRLRVVSFMTDGYIGNESQILAAIHEKLGAARIFSFGIGNSVNRYLLESMAKMGRGAVAFVGLDESAGESVDLFYDRCARPALTDVEIDWGTLKVDSTYPRRVPDLFVGRPVLVTGRFEGSGKTTIRVAGRAGMIDSEFTLDVDLDDPGAEHAGITKLWARKKLAELGAIMTHSPSTELKGEMTDLSLAYSVQCRYTAFVAVDSSARTAGDHGVSVKVPVPVPDGVRYDTTVGE